MIQTKQKQPTLFTEGFTLCKGKKCRFHCNSELGCIRQNVEACKELQFDSFWLKFSVCTDKISRITMIGSEPRWVEASVQIFSLDPSQPRLTGVEVNII